MTEEFKSLDLKRKEFQLAAEAKHGLKPQGKIMLNIHKDHGEVLLSTSYQDLHKHGYKPFMRWGVLKETLTAACILESGILERARKTGKLHVWDPFCGSGSFLIENLMMILQRPCRNMEEDMPFQNWPIHQAKAFEAYREEIEKFKDVHARDNIDMWLIGSDISLKAIETSGKNIDFADFDGMHREGLIRAERRPVIRNPLIFQTHWPSS
jgi:putative N6-adenine-specific DNA methylase